MEEQPKMSLPTRYIKQIVSFVFFVGFILRAPMPAQDVLGGITGTVKDSTGAAVPDATVRARNVGTNPEVVQHPKPNGSSSVKTARRAPSRGPSPKKGFEPETPTQVL